MAFLFSGAKKVISIDPSSGSVKIVEVLLRGKRPPLVANIFYEKAKDPQAVRSFLEKIKGRLDFKKATVVLAVHGIQSIYRLVETPKLEEVELTQAIKYEEEVYMPFPPEERVVDYCIVGEGEKNYYVALVGVKKSNILDLAAQFTDVGFPLDVAELAGISLVNLFNFTFGKEMSNKSIVLLDIGSKYTIFVVIKGQIPMIIREIPIGGDLFTEQIEDSLQVQAGEAELLKCNPGDKREEVIRAMEPMFYRLTEEIKVSMEYTGHISIGKVEEVFISGGGSRTPGLRKYLAKGLGMKISEWDCLAKFAVDKGISSEILDLRRDTFHVTLGAALK